MYGYAGSSATAAQLTPFTEPPRTTTNPAGLAGQGAAVAQAVTNPAGLGGTFQPASTLAQLTSLVPNALQGLTSPTAGASEMWSLLSSPSVSQTLSMLTGARLLATTPYSVVRYANGGRNVVTALNLLGDVSRVSSCVEQAVPGLGPFGLGGFVDAPTERTAQVIPRRFASCRSTGWATAARPRQRWAPA